MAKHVQPEIDWALVYAILAGEADEIQETKWRDLFLSSEEYRDLYAALKPRFEDAERTGAISRLERLNKLHLPQPAINTAFRFSGRWNVAATVMLLAVISSLIAVFSLRRSPTRQPITWQYIKAVPGTST